MPRVPNACAEDDDALMMMPVECPQHPEYRVSAPARVWEALASEGVWVQPFPLRLTAARSAPRTQVVSLELGDVVTLTGRRGRAGRRALAVQVPHPPYRRRCY